MTQFELFCMIFFALDSAWDETHDENLGQFLSEANPFLWKDITSADPALFIEFCEQIPQANIPIEDSYRIASEYVHSLPGQYELYEAVPKAFTVTPEQWLEGVKEYLSKPHKK